MATLALATPAGAQLTGEQALSDLNAWRAELGLPAVTTLDAQLSEGCRLHNAYRALHGPDEGHYELRDRPGWSVLGAAAGQSSVLSVGSTPGEGPRAIWEYAVYHRTGLLNPRLRTTWWSQSERHSCMGTVGGVQIDDFEAPETEDNSPQARSATLLAYPSPANGATGVPVEMGGFEDPDPRDTIPGRPDRIGWPLSVNFNGPWDSWALADRTIDGASLTPDGGTPVPIATQADLSGVAIGLFPHAPLAPGRWYTARVAGTVQDNFEASYPPLPYDVSWRFRTAVGDPSASLSMGGRRPDRRCLATAGCTRARPSAWLRLSSQSPATATVRLVHSATGRAAATLSARPNAETSLDLGPGRYRACATQPESDGFASWSQCSSHRIVAYPTVSIAARARRSRDGRSLRVVVTADPSLVGRRANVVTVFTKRVCRKPRSGRRIDCLRVRRGVERTRRMRLRARNVVRVPAPPKGVATRLRVGVSRFAVGDASYSPVRGEREYFKPRRAPRRSAAGRSR